MATTQLAHSVAFMAMVSLLIKLVLLLLRSCGRATFYIVVWLGFNTLENSIFSFGLEYKLSLFLMGRHL